MCATTLLVDIVLVSMIFVSHQIHKATRRAARLELVLSILFSLQLTVSWRTIPSVFLSPGSGGWSQGGVPSVTFVLAIMLLLLQIAIAIHFYRRIGGYLNGSSGATGSCRDGRGRTASISKSIRMISSRPSTF